MSGVSSTTGASSSSVAGSNVAPISFPGIASGIDYNSIIQKLTSLTLAPVTGLNQQIATLNAANAELIKIDGLLSGVQSSLTSLSQPNIYNAVSATSSNTAVATASGIAGGSASPGTYLVTNTQLATATQVVSNTKAGHSELDPLGASTGDQVPLASSYAAITPKNGGAQGSITINGVSVSYDVNAQSIQQIFANINSAVQAATGDTSFNIGFVAGSDTVQITDANNPISIGSPSDQGNLLQVLRLDQAQIVNGASGGSVTATAGVGGINQALEFASTNSSGTATNGNYVAPVTSGVFTINGVQISVNASTDNLYSVLQRISQSAAGVNATYNAATGQITLTDKTTGAHSIVLGASTDTSNFLSASGLTSSSGAATTIGKQASVTFQDASGGSHTVFSNSNTVANAIPGVQINLLSNSAQPFQITVGQDSSQLVTALNAFVSAYNAAITEINTATAPPVVVQGGTGSTVGAAQSAAVGAGVLYGNANVQTIKDALVNMVDAYNPNNPGAASLSSIGLTLTSSFAQLTASGSGASSTSQPVTTQTIAGTDGRLQPLDESALDAVLATNPNAVQNLLNGAQGMVTQMGTYLTNVTGMPTQTAGSMLGSIPAVSLLQGFENANNSEVDSIKQQITQIQDNANQQADALRAEFVQTEASLAQYQSLQQQLGSFLSGGSTSSGH